jgi:dihydrofolate reductase
VKLALVWAMARNRTIGRDNALPWHLPEDLKFFKRVTMGKPIIMGRKTWDSIGRPLPGRCNIVISRNKDFKADGIEAVSSLQQALSLAEQILLRDSSDEVCVIGGAEIYAQALPQADRLYLTQVHADVAGDTFFPQFDMSQWQEVEREDFAASGDNLYDYSFLVLEKGPQAH